MRVLDVDRRGGGIVPSANELLALAPLRDAMLSVFSAQLQKNKRALEFLRARHWTEGEIKQANIGAYPTVGELKIGLAGPCGNVSLAEKFGLFDRRFEGCVVGLWHQPNNRTIKVWCVQPSLDSILPDVITTADDWSDNMPCYWPETEGKQPVLLLNHPLEAVRLIANGFSACAINSSGVTTGQAMTIAADGRLVVLCVRDKPLSRQAAEITVLRLNKLGVQPRVLEYRDFNTVSALSPVAFSSDERCRGIGMGGGEFLAFRILEQLSSEDRKRTLEKAVQWRRLLTGETLWGYVSLLANRGITLGPDTVHACRVFATLIETGHSVEASAAIVLKQTGLEITVRSTAHTSAQIS